VETVLVYGLSLIAVVAAMVVALVVIHKQTTHSRDAQNLLLQRQQFNFENQWRLWLSDREKSDQTITSLAQWNAQLCGSHEQMSALLQKIVQALQERVTYTLTQHIDAGMERLAESLEKKHPQT